MKHKKIILAIVKGLFLMYALTGICLLLLTFLLYRFEISTGVLSGGMTLTYLLSGFVGGFLLGRHVISKRFLWGTLEGMLYFLGIFFMSVLLQHGFPENVRSVVITAVLCLLAGMAGGMLSHGEK